jgi:hypothetical protein
MREVLTPRLTALDERVLAQLPQDGARRARDIARDVYRRGSLRCATTQAEMDELVGILRGLEHIGLVAQAGGWWRRDQDASRGAGGP